MKKKRSKAGLGLFLLKSFRRTGRPAKLKTKRSAPRVRLSLMRVDEKPKPRVRKKLQETQPEASVHLQPELPVQSQPVQLELPVQLQPLGMPSSGASSWVDIQLQSSLQPWVPPQAQLEVPVQSPVPVLPYREPSLLTQDLLKPNDQLRQSIEAFLLDQRSPHTRRAYGKDLKRFVQYLHARKFQQGIEKLGRSVLIAYKESLLSEKLEHTTVDRHIATLRSFFKWLVDDGVLSKSPADGVRFLNPKRLSTTLGFSDEEVKKVLTVPNLHTRTGALHYAILMVLFYCGLRRSELCELRTSHLGTERGQRVLRLRGKGNAERIIVLVPQVWNAVTYYFHIARRDLTQDDILFCPIRNNRTGVLQKPIDPSMIFYIVRKYAKIAGVMNRVSPHSCRATAISNARDHHVPDRAIQEFAGWASPDMITRYDKRKNSVENSASRAISYGEEERSLPDTIQVEIPEPVS